MSKSCLIRIVRFAEIPCHDVNSLNTPGMPHAMSFASSNLTGLQAACLGDGGSLVRGTLKLNCDAAVGDNLT
ncbi:hypothetical protein ACB092_10G138000 [Castanea dentata]